MNESFTREEAKEAARILRAGGEAACPRCAALLEGHDIPPRRDVGYVRHRLLVTCGACGARGVVDRREIEEPDRGE